MSTMTSLKDKSSEVLKNTLITAWFQKETHQEWTAVKDNWLKQTRYWLGLNTGEKAIVGTIQILENEESTN